MRKRLYFFVVMMLTTICAFAQSLHVKGTVTDENKEPVIGAYVRIKGVDRGALTDVNGKFELKNVKKSDQLVLSFIGMKTITVSPKANMNIIMESNDKVLDEVMVVAFGEQKKSSFTGSADVIDMKLIEQRQVNNVMDALQGIVSGLQSYSHSGAPDANPEFRIRGISSINAGNNPLIVLDGVPYDGEWNSINPADVASVTVLKDAASNALYGARGANGVIIVTTKKGDQNHTTIGLDMKVGSSSRASKRYKTIDNPAQYLETYYQSLYNANIAKGQSVYQAHLNANNTLYSASGEGGLGYLPYTVPAGQYLIGDNGKLNPNATLGNRVYNNGQVYTIMPDDWIDETYRNALRQEYNININGGGQQGQFYASLGYLNSEGIAIASDYERYTARLKASYKAAKWLNVGGNVNFARSTSNNGADVDDTEDDGGTNIYTQISQIGPIYPVYLRDGNGNILRDEYGPVGDYGDGQILGSAYVRPYLKQSNGITDATLNTNKKVITSFSLNGFADIDIWNGLSLTLNGSVYTSNYRSTYTYNPFYGYGHANFPNGYVYKDNYTEYSLNFQQLLKYTKKFGNNNISLLAGHESYDRTYEDIYGERKNMFSYFDNQELNGATTLYGNGSSSLGYNTEGWIFRALYDWDGKYFGQVSYRRDASSRFHPDHRWGNFYSLGGAWMLTKESWMESAKWLNTLKLKASFGQNGNDNISDFLYVDTYNITKGDGNEIGLTLLNIGNERITWETVNNINVGLEFDLFKNRLRGSLEYFYRKTSDMLCSVKVPLSMGYAGYSDNVGDMANSGVELELTGDIVSTKDWTWTLGANITGYKNEILKLNADNRNNVLEGHVGYNSGSYFYGEGLPMYTWRMRKYAGVSDDGQSMWYMHDADGNLTTTTNPTEITRDEDFFNCGTALPDCYGGFNTSLSAYGFDLSVSFAYSVGGKVLDCGYQSLMDCPTAGLTGEAIHEDMLKAWSSTNTSSSIPRYQYGDTYAAYTSDRFLIDGSWLSLQNITLGYNLPKKWLAPLHITGVRLSVSGENLTYWSKRKGLDPRSNNYGMVSSDTKYAPARTIIGGINVQF